MDMAKPIIRFKGYQDDWEQRKLGEISDSYSGGTPTAGKSEYYGGDIPFIRSAEVNSDSTELFLTDEGLKNSSAKMVNKGDILYALYGATSGETGLARLDGAINQAILDIKPHENYDAAFIMQWLRKSKENIIGTYLQGGQGNLSGSIVTSLMIDCPNHEEQKLIGEYFQNLDHLITLHQRKCDETKRLKKYMLQKMFPQNGKKVPEIRFSGFTDDWEQRKLGDLVIDHNAGIYISKEDYGEGTNVIGVGNIYDRDIFDGEIYRLGPVNDDRFILDENDILYGESSLVPEGIARTVCVGKNGAGSAFAWHTRRVKLDKNIVNSHVATLELNYLHDIRKYLVSVSTQTALTGMTTEGYFGVTLTLPSVEEQQKISDYFKNLDHLITLHQRELENLQNIKKFMLEKMFV